MEWFLPGVSLRDRPRLSTRDERVAQAEGAAMIQKQGSSQGRAGQQNVTGELALAWGLKASPRFAWADKEEDRY